MHLTSERNMDFLKTQKSAEFGRMNSKCVMNSKFMISNEFSQI
jgi:hypothetical protein